MKLLFSFLLGISTGPLLAQTPIMHRNQTKLSSAGSITYYVSDIGNDANSGLTPSAAFASIAKINSLDLNPGDRVLFKGGGTFFGAINLTSEDSGLPTNPIVIGSFGGDRATISSGVSKGFYALNTEGIQLRDLKFTGTDGGLENHGVLFLIDNHPSDLDYIHIDNVEATGYGGCGICVSANNTNNGFNDIRITNTNAHDNHYDGLVVKGFWLAAENRMQFNHTNVYVGHCLSYNNTGSTQITDNHSGSGIFVCGVIGGLIEYCDAHNNGNSNSCNGCGPIGIWTAEAQDVIIQYNESYSNKRGFGGDGGGFDIDGGAVNCIVQFNYSHDNDGAGLLLYEWGSGNPFSGNIMRYNLTVNDGQKDNYAALVVGSEIATASGEVYNNTVYSNKAALAFLSTAQTWSSLFIKNNIFIVDGPTAVMKSAGTPANNTIINHNIYYAFNGASLNFSDGGIIINPLLESPAATAITVSINKDLTNFLSGYRLNTGSPAINAGINIPGACGSDFFKNAIPNGRVDIGCHQHD